MPRRLQLVRDKAGARGAYTKWQIPGVIPSSETPKYAGRRLSSMKSAGRKQDPRFYIAN